MHKGFIHKQIEQEEKKAKAHSDTLAPEKTPLAVPAKEEKIKLKEGDVVHNPKKRVGYTGKGTVSSSGGIVWERKAR